MEHIRASGSVWGRLGRILLAAVALILMVSGLAITVWADQHLATGIDHLATVWFGVILFTIGGVLWEYLQHPHQPEKESS